MCLYLTHGCDSCCSGNVNLCLSEGCSVLQVGLLRSLVAGVEGAAGGLQKVEVVCAMNLEDLPLSQKGTASSATVFQSSGLHEVWSLLGQASESAVGRTSVCRG